MGGYRHTNVDDAAARTEYARADQVQDCALSTLSSVSGADTITATAPLSMTAYVTGQEFSFVSAGANTGAVTLNINSIGAKDVTKRGTTALDAGDIPSGAVVVVQYDGTRFQLTGPAPAPTVLPAASETVAGVVELATNAEAQTGTDTERAITPANLAAVTATVISISSPAGAVMFFAMTSAPTGWLEANGDAVSRTTYAALFSAIGTVYGAGDGSTTFNLPDLRGEFIRGADGGRGVDSGRVMGSFQQATAIADGSGTGFIRTKNTDGTESTTGGYTVQAGSVATETYRFVRPRNVALLPCIKT